MHPAGAEVPLETAQARHPLRLGQLPLVFDQFVAGLLPFGAFVLQPRINGHKLVVALTKGPIELLQALKGVSESPVRGLERRKRLQKKSLHRLGPLHGGDRLSDGNHQAHQGLLVQAGHVENTQPPAERDAPQLVGALQMRLAFAVQMIAKRPMVFGDQTGPRLRH